MEYYWIEADGENYQNLGFSEGLPYGPSGEIDWQWTSLSGHPLQSTSIPMVEVVRGTKTRKKPDIYFFTGVKFLLNERAKGILEKVTTPETCQFVPLSLIDGKKKQGSVYILNPLIIGDACLIREKSLFKQRAGVSFLETPCIDEKKISSSIFIILEEPGFIIINRLVHDLLDNAGVKGLIYHRVETCSV